MTKEHGQSGSAEKERDDLAAAVKDVLGTLNHYIGPAARTGVSMVSENRYWRLWLAYNRAVGKSCPRCDDTGRDNRYDDDYPCRLAEDRAHGLLDDWRYPRPLEPRARMAGMNDPITISREDAVYLLGAINGDVSEDGKRIRAALLSQLTAPREPDDDDHA